MQKEMNIGEVTAAKDLEEAKKIKSLVSRFVVRSRMRCIGRLNYIDYSLRKGDVIVNSTAKSGQTLTMHLLRLMKVDGDVSKLGLQIQECQWVEVAYPDDDPNGEGFVAVPLDEQIRRLESLPSPRVFKSHIPWPELARSRDPAIQATIKYVCITRHVFDLPVSFYRHLSNMNPKLEEFWGHEPLPPSFADWFSQTYIPNVLPVQVKFLNLFWPHRNDDNVIWIKFHELLADKRAHILKLAAFLGWPEPSAAGMDNILKYSTPDYMAANGTRLLMSARAFPEDKPFVNADEKKKVAGNKGKLSDEQLQLLKTEFIRLAQYPDMVNVLWPDCTGK